MRAPRMAHPVKVTDVAAQELIPYTPNVTHPGTTYYFVDFAREFQGGLRINVKNGVAGTTVRLVAFVLF